MTLGPTLTAASNILAVFDELQPAQRESIADILALDTNPFAVHLGRALSLSGLLAEFEVQQAVGENQFDHSAEGFAESLGDELPWPALKQAIYAAIEADAEERRNIFIAPDGPAS